MHKKMRIAMLGHKRVPSREGGVEIVVEELSKRMVSAGYYVTCFNRKGHHIAGAQFDCDRKKEYRGIKLEDVFTISGCGLAAVSSSICASIKAAFGNYDVVHIHAEGPAFMCWLPKLLRKKVIVTIHGLDWERSKWGKFASWYIRQGEKNAIRFADEVIVLSENVKKYFLEKYKREVVFLPNGVVKPSIREAQVIIRKWGLYKDDYILYLGRVVPEKGCHYLIEAFRKINTQKKLVIAGGSSDTDEYFDYIKSLAKDDDRIVFTGFVQGRELEELYSNSYIYVLPSDLEGMPLSLLEAMSYGNCCIVSDIPECAEVVEDKAITFPRGNVVALASALKNLLNNSEVVRQYKELAIDFIIEKYNWDSVVKQTIELYKK